eukprot:scaffold58725_cov31-Tisochrysis_lutea.AAC.2
MIEGHGCTPLSRKTEVEVRTWDTPPSVRERRSIGKPICISRSHSASCKNSLTRYTGGLCCTWDRRGYCKLMGRYRLLVGSPGGGGMRLP